MTLSDAVAERSGLILSADAETACEEIEESHPDLLRHIEEAEKWVAEESEKLNSWTASQFRGTMRGCIWFRDPVTCELLLGMGGSWILRAMDENVWLPLSLAFPVLTPYMLTGPVTDMYALHVEDVVYADLVENELKKIGVDINEHCRIRKATEMWIVFSGAKEKMACQTSHQLVIGKKPVEGVRVIGAGELIPIPNTAEWRDPPEYAVQLRTGADFVEMRRVPDPLFRQFFKARGSAPSHEESIFPDA